MIARLEQFVQRRATVLTSKFMGDIITMLIYQRCWEVKIVKMAHFEEFVSFISDINRNIKRIEREEMAKYGLKGPCAQYLAALIKHSEGITAAKLCKICDSDKGAVSRAVTEMESHGLIRREVAGSNAGLYRAILKLTDEGRRAAHYVSERAKLAMEAAASGLSEVDREGLYCALERIAANLHDINLKGIPEQ